jgi:excisionase family DNA binding protein
MAETLRDTLTIDEVAGRLGISVTLARKAARAGDLPAIKFRGRFLILRKAFDKMLNLESDVVSQLPEGSPEIDAPH